MIDTLRQREGEPDVAYPVPGLSEAAEALDPAALWHRIEAYIAHRWHPRPVTWVLQGAGEWTPPLTPTTIDSIGRWYGTSFEPVDVYPAPLGYCFEHGTYQVQATVGADEQPPAEVMEAYRRLAEYLADDYDVGTVANHASVGLGNALTMEYDRPNAWQAKALQHSGAADLLRRYRRV
ncbi:hypothetical protein T35B1_16941 [Salinisphaera shabanensis T35B1]|uniref:hypothetical protein n=1 Tax=Salinisphaera shabanensis TaxID=180542 RepID=UPI003341083D